MSSAARYRVDEALLLQAASQLTDRDRLICRLLFEHRVLTSSQVCDVAFDGMRRTCIRLAKLRQLRVIERFRPFTPLGSAPYHWVLDVNGAVIMAGELGCEIEQLPWRRDKALALSTNQHLGHLVGVNGFFTSLIGYARRHTGCELALWWPERRCRAAWGDVVAPDGHGVWAAGGRRLPFLLEYDNGTEVLSRLEGKVDAYAKLLEAAGQPIWILFSFRSTRREAEARRVLAHPGVPVSTAVLAPGGSAAEAIWLPVGGGGGARVSLIDLGDPSTFIGRSRG